MVEGGTSLLLCSMDGIQEEPVYFTIHKFTAFIVIHLGLSPVAGEMVFANQFKHRNRYCNMT
jgi:hypothetical protein